MNNDFYNRVFLSNKLLNTNIVQPVISHSKIDDTNHNMIEEKKEKLELKKNYLEEKIEENKNSLEEKLEKSKNYLEEKIESLENRIKELEEKIHSKNIEEIELDNIVVTD